MNALGITFTVIGLLLFVILIIIVGLCLSLDKHIQSFRRDIIPITLEKPVLIEQPIGQHDKVRLYNSSICKVILPDGSNHHITTWRSSKKGLGSMFSRFRQVLWSNCGKSWTLIGLSHLPNIEASITKCDPNQDDYTEEDTRVIVTGYIEHGEIALVTLVSTRNYRYKGTVFTKSKYPRTNEMCFTDGELNVNTGQFTLIKRGELYLPEGITNSMQKNWVPFVYNKQLYLVTSINPLHIIKRTEEGNCIDIKQDSDQDFESILLVRGGTQLVPVTFLGRKLMLGIGHTKDKYQGFLHVSYVLEAEPPFKMLGISREFCFDHDNIRFDYPALIEFAAGICQDGETMKVSFGVNNDRSCISTIRTELLVNLALESSS